MTRSVQLIRLLASVLIAFAACYFVVQYDAFSTIRFPFDHPQADGHWVPPSAEFFGTFVRESHLVGAEFVTAHRKHAYAVPVVGLLVGILVIWRWPRFHVLTELVVSAMWVLGLLWAGFAVLMWHVQNIPIYHGGRWHY
jgi:Trk-type K+ transport system membrane component